jgi:hypothetical protein
MKEQAHYKVHRVPARRRPTRPHRRGKRPSPPHLKAMLTARQQREAVEECITRQRERHQREQQNQERKLLDELALRRAGAARTFADSD